MSSRNGPIRRLGSPPGGSIFTTSAPRSPKSLPQNWPFASASSRTLRPASGPERDWASLTGASPPCTESAPAHRPERAVGEARTEVFAAVYQQAFDNLSRVLTDQRARQVVRRRGFGKFERSILHLASSERRMLHFEIHLAVAQLRITLDPVFGALYRKGANTRRLTALRQLVFTQGHAPSFDLLVQFLLVLQASGDGGEFRRGGP